MNWEAVGAVAELLAAIGGIAAVVYLAVQIRLNTRAVRSASIDSWVAAIALGNESLASTDDFIALATGSYDELDPRQRTLFHRALAQNMNAIAEIIGGAVVIISLIYLARQVRENSLQVKLGSTISLNHLINEAFYPIYNND